MSKKLYELTVEYKAYVWAEDRWEAEDLASEVIDTEDPTVTVFETRSTNTLGWTDETCVYHNDEGDVYLRDVKTW